MSYSAEVLADSPKGYWKLNEPSGNFVDSSGNGFTLTASGTITYQTVGPFGEKATTFGSGGTGSRSQISAVIDNLTIECWVYITAYSSDSVILCNQSAAHGYEVALNSSGKVTVTCQNVAVIGGAGSVVSLNTWTYIVVERDSGTWKSYINGILDQSSMGTTTPIAPSSSTTAVANTVFTGRLAHAAFYETVLSSTRVRAHYNALEANIAVGNINAISTLSSGLTLAGRNRAILPSTINAISTINHNDIFKSIAPSNINVISTISGTVRTKHLIKPTTSIAATSIVSVSFTKARVFIVSGIGATSTLSGAFVLKPGNILPANIRATSLIYEVAVTKAVIPAGYYGAFDIDNGIIP